MVYQVFKFFSLIPCLVVSFSILAANNVKITSMDDVAFGSVNITPSTRTFDVCVYSNGQQGNYTIKFTSANGVGPIYYMKSASGSYFIAYTLQYYAGTDASSQSSGTAMINGGTYSLSRKGHTTSTTCGGVMNGRVFISVVNTDFLAGGAETYTDTLTALVTAP